MGQDNGKQVLKHEFPSKTKQAVRIMYIYNIL
jgi:hypothetical protein